MFVWLTGAATPAYAQLPDLVAANVTLQAPFSFSPTSATLFLGAGKATLWIRVWNKSAFDIASGSTVNVWACTKSTITGGGAGEVLCGTFQVPTLAAGTLYSSYVTFDPSTVGPFQNQALTPGVYYLAAQLDANDQVRESNEANIFYADKTLAIGTHVPTVPLYFLPPSNSATSGYRGYKADPYNISVDRQLEWTTSTFASRYDVYLARLRDTTQVFYPHALLTGGVGTQKIVATDLSGIYNPSMYHVYGNNYGGYINNWGYREPELLVTQDNHLFCYYNKNYSGTITPQYFPAVELLQTTNTTNYNTGRNASYIGSMVYDVGTITSVLPVNFNFYTHKDSVNADFRDSLMDVVATDYISGESIYTGTGPYPTTYYPEGSVYVLLNTTGMTTATKTRDSRRWESMSFDKWRLDSIYQINNPPDANKTHQYGIKSVAAADFDDDGDVDIVSGSDRITNWSPPANDKLVFHQNAMRQIAGGKTDPWNAMDVKGVPFKPTFVPYAPRGNINTMIDDAQEMVVGDFDLDGRVDIAVASFYGHCVWIIHNETDTGGDVRTTRTLSFSVQPKLQAFQLDGVTTDPLHGAMTLCSADLNNDHKADLVAGGYLDGRLVVYENRSTYNGDTMNPSFIPHVLTDNNNSDPMLQIPNLTKVTCADMNGDGLMDIVACSPTNSKIVWFENNGNYRFTAHLVSEKAASVSSIAVTDLTGDMVPDVIGISRLDKTLTWWGNWPILDGSKKAASNLIQPHYQPAKPFDFWTTYVWMVASKATDAVQTQSPYMFFRTQAARVKLTPTLGAYSTIEPGAGIFAQFHATCDGLPKLRVYDFTVKAYADPVLDRAFFYGYVGFPYPLSTRYIWMDEFNWYEYRKGYTVGATDDLTLSYDGSTLAEGLYNFYIQSETWSDLMEDGVRNGIIDGVPDGYDQVIPGSLEQLNSNYFWGDDVYKTPEKLTVVRKPGIPDIPTPANNAVNVPTGTPLKWTGGSAASGFDVMMTRASKVAPTFTSMTISATVPAASSIDSGDVDGDGQIDLAASYFYNTTWHTAWFKNQGKGARFTMTNVGNVLAGPADVSLVKMSKNSTRLDMLVASPGDAQIMWYKNIAAVNQQFPSLPSLPLISSTADGVNTARAADINGDGRPDVVAAMSGLNGLCWFESSDDNGLYFSMRTIESSTSGHGMPQYAIPADVNGDGKMDIVATFWYPNSVAWYENKGGSPVQFVRHEITTTLNMPKALAVGDLNNDNSLDIVCVAEKDAKIVWFQNDGAETPNFNMWAVASGLTGVNRVTLTDYNHDALQDIITATTAGNKILYYSNGGGTTPAFTPYTIGTQKSGVTALASGDLDGDTFPEVIAANANGTMSWFDYVQNFTFNQALVKQNNAIVSSTTYQPSTLLDPSMGYQWQILAKRVVEVYGGYVERVTTSSANRGDNKPWTFFTSQSDLTAQILTMTPRTVTQGEWFQIVFQENNIGLSDSAPHITEFWASLDTSINRGGNDVLLGRASVPAIKAGSYYRGTFWCNTADTGYAGGYYLFVDPTKAFEMYNIGMFANTWGDNSESRFDNNKYISPYKVTLMNRKPVKSKNSVGAWNTYQ